MKSSDIPAKIVLPFANGAGASYIRSVPVGSQIGVVNGAASYTDGFPPDTFVPEAAGGYPPDGRDFNGLLNTLSGWSRWVAAAGLTYYDSAFSTSISGYPSGAVLIKADDSGLWISTVDDNTSDPDTGGAGWATLALSQSAADARYAKLAGLNTQAFSVAAATTSAQAVNLGQFVRIVTTPATFNILPDGTIIQRGYLSATTEGTYSVIFPTAFTTRIDGISLTTVMPSGAANADWNSNLIGSPSLSSMTVYQNQQPSAAAPAPTGFYWMALGY